MSRQRGWQAGWTIEALICMGRLEEGMTVKTRKGVYKVGTVFERSAWGYYYHRTKKMWEGPVNLPANMVVLSIISEG